jgi:dihydrofolate reductase
LVDEFWLFINPILIGQGMPFFKDKKQKTKLKLLKSYAFTSGVVCLHYEKI